MILISQILGCLIVAAGIGGAVGWLLQYLPTRQLTQQFRDLTATLRLKEQRLEKAQYELKVQTASMARGLNATEPSPSAATRVGLSHRKVGGFGGGRPLCIPPDKRAGDGRCVRRRKCPAIASCTPGR
jgi:hypothetical protein